VDDQIVRVVDFGHCPWVIPAASSIQFLDASA